MISAQGWLDFLKADGVDDWVVLHGGPTAVFRVASLPVGARLAALIAEVPGLDGTRAVVTVSSTAVTVRLSRELWGTEPRHAEIARAISALVRDAGATPDRSAVQEIQVAVASKPESFDVGFWRAVLGYSLGAPDNGIDPLGHGSTVWMQDLDPQKPLRHAMHLDVSVAKEHAAARVEAAVAAGGRMVDASNAPGSWIVADRAGNKVCVASWPDGSSPKELDEAAAAAESAEAHRDLKRANPQ